jgi:hypothetical protein
MFAGRLTFLPMISAWNCIKKSFAHAPPSTINSLSDVPASVCTASKDHGFDTQWLSSAARTICSLRAARVNPQIMPRASASNMEQPKPENAGTI